MDSRTRSARHRVRLREKRLPSEYQPFPRSMMALPTVSMHDPGVYMKEEPQDDEDLFIPDANALPSATTRGGDDQDSNHEGDRHSNQHQNPNSTRARAADGQPFNSQCFQTPYLNRPQFHRLRCGHDITTTTVEACGSNCHPPTRYIGSDSKPNEANFECLHPSCKRRSNVVPRINPKTRRCVYGRDCQLAHVRGRDPQADQAWDIEKKEMLERKGRLRARSGGQELSRKTSRSPPPKKFPMQPPTSRVRRGSTILSAEEIGQQMDGPTRKLFAAQKGKHTRKPRGDRPETQSDIKLDAAEQDLSDIGIGGQRWSRSQKGRKKSSRQKQSLFFREDIETSPDPDQEHGEGDEKDDAGEEPVEIHCVCKSSDLRLMVECNRCDAPYYPGCIGKGAYHQIQYELPNRDESSEFDARHSTSYSLCLACEAHGKLEAGISSNRRKEADVYKHKDLLLQFIPRLSAHKQAALDRAEGREQVAIVETHFAIIKREMEKSGNLQVWHWKSLLAQALKVPLPSTRVHERRAEETGPDHRKKGPAARSRAQNFDNRAESDNTPSAALTHGYQAGEQMILTVGRPPQKAPRTGY